LHTPEPPREPWLAELEGSNLIHHAVVGTRYAPCKQVLAAVEAGAVVPCGCLAMLVAAAPASRVVSRDVAGILLQRISHTHLHRQGSGEWGSRS
jgi:hypothetical protein